MTYQLLKFAPLITPISGILGFFWPLTWNQHADHSDAVFILAGSVCAMLLGLPAGLLFGAMRGNDEKLQAIWAIVMIAYCISLFVLFFIPSFALVSV